MSTTTDRHTENVPKDYSPATRVEPIPKPTFPHADYPRWIGHKFRPSGEVIPFPGNTVICHLSHSSRLHAQLRSLHEILRAAPFTKSLALLPTSSYHMTMYEGISYQIPQRELWPKALPLNCSLSKCHAHITKALADYNFEGDLKSEQNITDLEHAHNGVQTNVTNGALPNNSKPPYKMYIESFETLTDGIALNLVPSTPTEEKRLRALRDNLADKVGLRHPGFEDYSFHLSIAYLLKWLSKSEQLQIQKVLDVWLQGLKEEERCFELGTPEVCVYDDMCEFRRVFYLGDGDKEEGMDDNAWLSNGSVTVG